VVDPPTLHGAWHRRYIEHGCHVRSPVYIAADCFFGQSQHYRRADHRTERCFRRRTICFLFQRIPNHGGSTLVPASSPGARIHLLDAPGELPGGYHPILRQDTHDDLHRRPKERRRSPSYSGQSQSSSLVTKLALPAADDQRTQR
ncbi:unnamed protein product, partial [Ectocarpus fasciculatus]